MRTVITLQAAMSVGALCSARQKRKSGHLSVGVAEVFAGRVLRGRQAERCIRFFAAALSLRAAAADLRSGLP
jgi:hypothetical protein